MCRRQPSPDEQCNKCFRIIWRKVWCICVPLSFMSILVLRANPPIPPLFDNEKSKAVVSAVSINQNEDIVNAIVESPFASVKKDIIDPLENTVPNLEESQWEVDLSPKIVWLSSYPNSGTSFTMTLVERASNLSTATNYGDEVTHKSHDSVPLYPNHQEGPFWKGTSENALALKRVIRDLPYPYILTKTHCGGRCIKCPASEYLVNTTRQFIYGCQKSSYRKQNQMVTTETGAPMSAIKRMIHMIRNPFHNVVARFHLERKNMISKNSSLEELFPYNSTGFHNWCHYLDSTYGYEDEQLLPSTLYEQFYRNLEIPCHAEFFKWTQWHNYVVQSAALLGLPEDRTQQPDSDEPTIPVHVVWYEDYATNFNRTFEGIMEFLQLPIAAEGEIRSFRSLPSYADHYSSAQAKAVQSLIQHVARPKTWELIQHYF